MIKSLNKVYCPLHLSLHTCITTLHKAVRVMLSALMQIIFVITETALVLHYNLHGQNCNWADVKVAKQQPLRFVKNSGPQMAGWSMSDRNILLDFSLSLVIWGLFQQAGAPPPAICMSHLHIQPLSKFQNRLVLPDQDKVVQAGLGAWSKPAPCPVHP